MSMLISITNVPSFKRRQSLSVADEREVRGERGERGRIDSLGVLLHAFVAETREHKR